jgi:hypothetical protein
MVVRFRDVQKSKHGSLMSSYERFGRPVAASENQRLARLPISCMLRTATNFLAIKLPNNHGLRVSAGFSQTIL